MNQGLVARAVHRPRSISVSVVVLVALYAAGFSGSESFTTLYNPDSEFYFSLGVFGGDVTARAPYDAYYWTRLGVLGPQRLLTEVLGTWNGLAAYRATLILLLATSSFALLRRLGATVTSSSLAAVVVTLNTVVLAFVGDPYVTGTALAGLVSLWALAVSAQTTTGPTGLVAAAGAGAAGGWLAMINPYAMLLGGATTLALTAVLTFERRNGLRRLFLLVALFTVGGVGSFSAFLLVGRSIFPGMSWLATTLHYVRVLNESDYTSPNWAWASTETSLLVPLACLLFCALVLAVRRSSSLARAGVTLVASTIGFVVGYVILRPGPWIEASFYNAMMWPGSLLGAALSGAALPGPTSERDGRRGMLTLVAIMGGAMTMWGHWSTPLAMGWALALATVGVALAAAGAVGATRGVGPLPPRVLGALALAVLVSTCQVLQNGRPVPAGVVPRHPYSAAFVDSGTESVLATDLAVERFVLRETSDHDVVLVWVQPGTSPRSPAAMQLWGPNALTIGATLSVAEATNARAIGTSVIVSYVDDPASIATVLASLPPGARPGKDRCEPFRVGPGQAGFTVCVTRLGWSPPTAA